MKKILLLILILAMFSLSSCEGLKDLNLGGIFNGESGEGAGEGEGEGGGNNQTGGGSSGSNAQLIWDSMSDLYVIIPDDASWKNSFFDTFLDVTSLSPIAYSDTKAKMAHELVIGPSTRPISDRAYHILEKNMTEDEDAVGYLLYAEGGSLAIAYSSEAGRVAAINLFYSDYLSRELRLEDGVVNYDFYSLSIRANEQRDIKREAAFLEIEKEHGKELADALRTLYTLYNEDTYIWMANLYDPETGGYYYSNSGRNSLGYLPDIESTRFLYTSLSTCGMFKEVGGISGAIPEDMQDKVVKWLQGLQSSEDGYFYHPQWGKSIVPSRRGRDLDWAESLLSQFGAHPYYNTPTGNMKGLYGAPGPNAVVPTTHRLGRSAISAVAAIVPAASNLPDYLQSLDAWEAHLDSLDVTGSPYSAGNTIASDHGLIKRAGTEYVDFVINYLNERQDPELGIWGRVENDTDYDPTDGLDYNTVNGLMKIACVYNYLGRPMNNIAAAMDSAIKIALYANTDADEHACCTYNPWTTMSMLISFEREVNGDAAAEALRKQATDVAPLLVRRTFEKAATHYVEGGGFSYFERRPQNLSQMANVACASKPEADLNAATVLTSSTLGSMFQVLGIKMVPLWYIDDYFVFINTVTGLSDTIKKEIPPVETVTFNDYAENEIVNDSELAPHDLVSVKINNHNYLKSKVVDRPGAGNVADLALRIETITTLDEDGNKIYAGAASNTYVSIGNKLVSGECYVFETDFRVDEAEMNAIFTQIFLAGDNSGKDTVGFNLKLVSGKNGPAIQIYDCYPGVDGKANSNIFTGFTLGEWFHIKLETYKIYDESEESEERTLLNVLTKIYINGTYIYTSDSADMRDGKLRDLTIDRAYFGHYRTRSSVIYIDNVRAEKFDRSYVKEYDPEEPNLPDVDIEPGVDYNYVAGFEQGRLNDAYMHSFAVTPDGTINVMKNSFDGEKYKDIIHYSLATDVGGRVGTVLRVQTTKQSSYSLSYSQVKVSNTEPAGNTVTYEMKYFLESAANGSVTQLHFMGENGKELVGINMHYDPGAGHMYLKQANTYSESSSGFQPGYLVGTGTGNIAGTYLPKDRWFTIRFVFFATGDPTTSRLKIYADVEDGETMKCISDTISYFNVNQVSNIKYVQVAYQRTNSAVVYLDDVSLTRTDLAYEAEEIFPTTAEMVAPPPDPLLPEIVMPDTIDGTTAGDVTDFSSGAIVNDYLTVSGGGAKNSSVDPFDTIVEGESFGGSAYTYYELKGDVTDKIDDLVLHVTTNSAQYPNYNNAQINLKASVAEEEGTVYTFQTDIMYTYKSQDALVHQFFFGDIHAPAINVKTRKGGAELLNASQQSMGVALIPYDEWVSIRFVLVAPVGNNNADNYVLHVYVKSSATGGEFTKQCSVSGYTNGTLSGMKEAFDTFYIYSYASGGIGDYYLDNMSFTRTVEP
ncbi:MAG: hypothetical protein IJW66_02620 [Clostridia bacterium]|nr:hypothetical protein [Clostridia bacterium]